LAALRPEQHRLVRHLDQVFKQAGEELYLVGGAVRDALLEREPPAQLELDLATSALPERTRELGDVAGATSAYLIGERFGTVGLVFSGESLPILVEITTYRHDIYPDQTRFPEVALGGSLIDDLARRDFTMNAIAADIGTGSLIDPFFGQADIAQGVIRAVGEADLRFEEDPLRLLRAARFVSQLGFGIATDTETAMWRGARHLERISQERIFAELTRLLTGEYVEAALDVLLRTGLLTVAMPALAPLAAEASQDAGPSGGPRRAHREKDLWRHTLRVVYQAPARPAVRWAALLHDAAKPLTRRVDSNGEVNFIGHERVGAELAGQVLRGLKADKVTVASVMRLVELHGRPTTYEEDWSDSAVRRLALDAGPAWEDLLDLAAADVTSGRDDRRQRAAGRIEALRAHFERLQEKAALDQLKSPLDGTELMAMFGREPGVWIKVVKDRLRDLVIDGELEPGDVDGAEVIARQIVRELDQQ
jgi:poly(A) polymerase